MTSKRMTSGPLRAVVLAALLGLAGAMVCRAVTEGTDLSQRRLELLRRLAQESLQRDGLEAGILTLSRAVLEEFFKADPGCPSTLKLAAPVTEEDCRQAARQIVRDLVARKYPDLDREALESEAAKRYPIYAEGDLVEVEYQANPVRRDRVRGAYQGRTPNSIIVGRRQVMIADMAKVAGNEELILRFDAERSGALRQEFIDAKVRDYEAERDAYAETVREVARRERYRLGAEENERRGYVFFEGAWVPVREAAPMVVEAERGRLQDEARRRAEEAVQAMQREARAVRTAELAAAALGGAAPGPDPAVERAALTARLEAEKARLAAADEARRQADAEAAAAAEAARRAAEEAARRAAEAAAAQPSTAGAEGGVPLIFLVIIGVIVLGLVVGAIAAFLHRRAKDPKRFFQGTGRLQRDFWAQAEADPTHFKYVAYRYPTMEEARSALLQLSYINEAPGAQLRCHRDILYGFYPHQDKFVSFVGGANLHYALWREASAVLPELPGAEYFRVSTAPDVMLEIPDIEQLLRDEDLKIEHVENREGEGDDYSRYFVYRAPDKQNALEFLKRARVSEPGVHVLVETPEGTWGKDENGIYQE
ncbi:MAG: hypothetical protein GX595_19510 [Lentisphaerae bacterium]|nr:hypothetical protein [Lentisphaerota bacterium]